MSAPLLATIKSVKKGSRGNGYPERSVTETIVNGFFTMDRKWTVIYWNKAAEQLLNIKAEDIIGKNLWAQFAGIIPLEFYNVYPKAFLLKLPFHFEEYWAELGAWFDVIVYHCDDTLSVSFKSNNQLLPEPDAERPEQRMETLNELYRFITEVSNDCLWEWDLQTDELFWIDGGHYKAFGYDVQNAFLPRSFWESRIHAVDKVRILANINKVMAGDAGNVWEDDYRFLKADGTYAYVHDHGYIIYDKNKAPARMIGTTLDITAMKLMEIKLAEAEKKIKQMEQGTQKNKGVESILPAHIAGVYYNKVIGADAMRSINKALANITLSAEMLEPLVHDNALAMFLDIIMRNSVRIDNLINPDLGRSRNNMRSTNF